MNLRDEYTEQFYRENGVFSIDDNVTGQDLINAVANHINQDASYMQLWFGSRPIYRRRTLRSQNAYDGMTINVGEADDY